MQLRNYQQEAVDAVYCHLRAHEDNPCAVIPTGGGKTAVIAQICKDAVGRWHGRVLVLAHVRELVEQAASQLERICLEVDVGVYSVGLRRRDTEHAVILAGIQSVYSRACELGVVDLIIIDEAHMIPPDGEGMYQTLLNDARTVNPNVRVIGLTATPFRLKSGLICAPDHVLNHVCYEIDVKELIRDGYLCALIAKAGRSKADTSSLHVRTGEFVARQTEELMDTNDLVTSACDEIVTHTDGRKSVLVFASGVRHAEHVACVLQKKTGEEVGTVFGDMLPGLRDQTLDDFRRGQLKYLVNVNVLTTGFDVPSIDCVVLLRPTLSAGLYYQMVGRGFRLHPEKASCLGLDFGGNVVRHGPVDGIQVREPGSNGNGQAPAKECPSCHSLIAIAHLTCPDCGHEFPPPERQQHDSKASTAAILSEVKTAEYAIRSVAYSVHHKSGAPSDTPRTLRVDYQVGWQQFKSEWICIEHSGWARQRAEAWWRERSDALVPETAAEAVTLANVGALCDTTSISVHQVTGEYDRIVGYALGEKPFYREPGWEEDDTDASECAVAATVDPKVPF